MGAFPVSPSSSPLASSYLLSAGIHTPGQVLGRSVHQHIQGKDLQFGGDKSGGGSEDLLLGCECLKGGMQSQGLAQAPGAC